MPPMPPMPMPPMPSMPPPGGMAGLGSGFSTTKASVVKTMPAMEPAFCKADRTTLVKDVF